MSMTRKYRLVVASACGLAILAGCSAPSTFVRTSEPEWRVVEFRPDLGRESAWHCIADVVALKHDIELMDRESGYLRTGWMYTQQGSQKERYRTRVIVKIPPSNELLRVKTDAQWLKPGSDHWVIGYDTAELETTWGDLQGVVGRVRR